MSILKPCPFCGGTELTMSKNDGDRFIQCTTCTTTGPNGSDCESAEIQWNQREAAYSFTDDLPNIDTGVKTMRCLKCDRRFKTTPEHRICGHCRNHDTTGAYVIEGVRNSRKDER
jgi:Lar family restriction alleviation protein